MIRIQFYFVIPNMYYFVMIKLSFVYEKTTMSTVISMKLLRTRNAPDILHTTHPSEYYIVQPFPCRHLSIFVIKKQFLESEDWKVQNTMFQFIVYSDANSHYGLGFIHNFEWVFRITYKCNRNSNIEMVVGI